MQAGSARVQACGTVPRVEQVPTSGRTIARANHLSDRRVMLAFVGIAVVLRLPFLATPLGIDEGGYAYVAANWGNGHGGMYGEQWVDRPPLLIALYAVAIGLAGDIGIRLLGCIAAALVVAACADTARRLAGRTAMAWTGAAATVLGSSTLIQSHTVNAELPAIAFTSLSVWATVVALQRRSASGVLALAALAGVAATAAVLVKQSFLDGLVFALAALVAASVLHWRQRASADDGRTSVRVPALVVGGTAGIASVVALLVAWAELVGPGTGQLFAAMYGFRLDARVAIAGADAPESRAVLLGALLVLSGMLSLFAFVWIGLARIMVGRQQLPSSLDALVVRATSAGLLGMGAFGVLAVSQGGNWWRHYLIQVVPMLAIGVGVVIAAGPGTKRSRVARGSSRWASVVVVATVAAWVATFGWSASHGMQRAPAATGDWLRAAARPGDTALVTWGHPNVLRRSGMETPYPLAWSLPIRVRDGDLHQLISVVGGPQAPTWIVEWNSFGQWDLDDRGMFRDVVELRYERVSSVCGRDVYRLISASSGRGSLPTNPSSEACGSTPIDRLMWARTW